MNISIKINTFPNDNDNYNIYTSEKLNSLMDEKGYIYHDIAIRGENIQSLEGLKKIYGSLGIDSKSLNDLGQLSYIEKDFWVLKSSAKLNSLCFLERVDGNVTLRYSNVNNLGSLSMVGGRLSIRDTNITDLKSIRFIKGNFLLSRNLKEINLDFIDIQGKVKYWTNESYEKSRKKLSGRTMQKVNINWENSTEPVYIPFKFSTIHEKELRRKRRILNGEILIKNFNIESELNGFVLKNIDEYYSFIDEKLDEIYNSKYSFFESLFGVIKTSKEINEEFQLKRNHSVRAYEEVKKKYPGKNKTIWLSFDENKFSYSDRSGRNIRKKPFIYYVENTIYEIFSSLVFNFQNDFRVSKGIPKIGEGWVSETELYYLLKYEFKDDEVIHHGKPKWLGRQHVDIWFPKYNVGIEYQGLQHDKPVEYFGGEESFLKGQLRDERKKELFIENNSSLIEVREGYKIELIIDNIKTLIKSNLDS